jgi:hypothetical protein
MTTTLTLFAIFSGFGILRALYTAIILPLNDPNYQWMANNVYVKYDTSIWEAILLVIIITRLSKMKLDKFTTGILFYCLVLAIFNLMIFVYAVSRLIIFKLKLRSLRKSNIEKYGDVYWPAAGASASDI